LCWEKSLVPIDIWKAGDSTSNIIESVHADVNREGVGCTLVGAVRKGQAFNEDEGFRGMFQVLILMLTRIGLNFLF
jgi:hypothetical protein